MNTLVHKEFFSTTIFSITGSGLRISRQTIFGYTYITVPYTRLGEEVSFGKTFNREFLYSAIITSVVAILKIAFTRSLSDIIFLSAAGIAIGFIVATLLSIRTTVKVPELKIFKYFSGNMDHTKLEKFLKTLFERRDDFMQFRQRDEKHGTNYEKQYANLVSLYTSNSINEKEFMTRRHIMKLSSFPNTGKSGLFYN